MQRRLWILCAVIGLFIATLVSAGLVTGLSLLPLEEQEPNDDRSTAMPIEKNTVMQGEVLNNRSHIDQDLYSVHLDGGESVTADITRTTGHDLFYVQFLSPDGRTATQLVQVRPGETGQVQLMAGTDGRYYFYVRGFETGAFSDEWQTYGAGEDFFSIRTEITDPNEPNDAPESATTVESGQRLTGEIRNSPDRLDKDEFSITVPEGATVTADIHRQDGQGQLYVRLLGPRPSLESFTTIAPDETRQLTTTASDGGQYLLTVHGFNESGFKDRWFEYGSGQYTVMIRVTGGPPTPTEASTATSTETSTPTPTETPTAAPPETTTPPRDGGFPGWPGMGGIGLVGFTIGFLTGNAKDQDVKKKSMGFLAIIFGGSGLFGMMQSPTIGWLVVAGAVGVLCGVVIGTVLRRGGFSFAP